MKISLYRSKRRGACMTHRGVRAADNAALALGAVCDASRSTSGEQGRDERREYESRQDCKRMGWLVGWCAVTTGCPLPLSLFIYVSDASIEATTGHVQSRGGYTLYIDTLDSICHMFDICLILFI